MRRRVVVQGESEDRVEFVFDVGAPALHGWLSAQGLSAAVTQDDSCWNLDIRCRCRSGKVTSGYICTLCPEDDRPVFASREARCRDHLFEPFLNWVNHELAPSSVIELFDSETGGFGEASCRR